MNLIRGVAQGGRITAGDLAIDRAAPDGEVAVGMRPEILTPSPNGLPSFEFLVDVVEPLGDEIVVHGTAQGTSVETGAEEEEIPTMIEGSRAPITARFDPRVRVHPGDRLRLGVEPERVHLFDLRSGAAIG